jgi:hypothetical protein
VGPSGLVEGRVPRSALVLGLLVTVVAGSAASAAAAGDKPTSASFRSPSRNIACEMNDGRPGVGSYVFCETFSAPRSVKLGLDGRLKVCRDASIATAHCLGDPGERTPVLGYGRQITLSHFRCRSLQNGVACTVIRTGRGFRIDRAGVHRIG